jgi:hypothetical protein
VHYRSTRALQYLTHAPQDILHCTTSMLVHACSPDLLS